MQRKGIVRKHVEVSLEQNKRLRKCTKLSEKSYLTQKEPCDKGADARKRVSHLGAAPD